MAERKKIFMMEYFFLNTNMDFLRNESICVDSFMMIFVDKGTAHVQLGGVDCYINTGRFLMVRPQLEMKLLSASNDFMANILGFPSTMLHENTSRIEPSYFMLMYKKIIWPLSSRDRMPLQHFVALFKFAVTEGKKMVYHRDMVLALVTSFVYGLYSFTHRYIENNNYDDSSRARELFKKFIELINTEYMFQHDVKFYAEKLCISAKYLTQITKRMIGRTPKQIIDEKLIYHASLMLSNNDSSIQEISNKLGFVDQSYFGRFFKRFRHVSPQQYRLRPRRK